MAIPWHLVASMISAPRTARHFSYLPDKWYRALPGGFLLVVLLLPFVVPPGAAYIYAPVWLTALAVAVSVLPLDAIDFAVAACRGVFVRWAFVNIVTTTLGFYVVLWQLYSSW